MSQLQQIAQQVLPQIQAMLDMDLSRVANVLVAKRVQDLLENEHGMSREDSIVIAASMETNVSDRALEECPDELDQIVVGTVLVLRKIAEAFSDDPTEQALWLKAAASDYSITLSVS